MERACLNTFLVMYIIDNERYIIVKEIPERKLIFKELKIPPRECDYIITDFNYNPPEYVADVLNNLDEKLNNGVYIKKAPQLL